MPTTIHPLKTTSLVYIALLVLTALTARHRFLKQAIFECIVQYAFTSLSFIDGNYKMWNISCVHFKANPQKMRTKMVSHHISLFSLEFKYMCCTRKVNEKLNKDKCSGNIKFVKLNHML